MKKVLVVVASVAVLASAGAEAATMAKKFDAGPAIAGNSDPAMPMHKKKAMKSKMMHKKAM